MDHLLLKAVTTVGTDEGSFTAVISAASIDREKDIVDPDGMVRALQKWIPTGKKIPLAWNHSTAPEHQIGYIDPATAAVKGGEVVASGWIDQSTAEGAHAWRQVKAGTLGFSFGYLTLKSSPLRGGGRHLKELDVFEVTATPTPMNNDTRVLSFKAAMDQRQAMDMQQTQVRILNSMLGQAQEFCASEADPEDVTAMSEIMDALRALGAEEASEGPEDAEDAGKSLRARADAVAAEIAASGVDTTPHAKVPEPDPEQKAAKSLLGLFSELEATAALDGAIKAVWTTAYVNNLPDGAFLYVEDGEKDADGKTTPRAKRHFPYKDASGNVDLPHLRNALARIPQSDLPQNVKDRLTAKAQKLLDDQQKAVDGTAQASGRAVDPLRARAEALALEVASGGLSLEKPPRPAKKAQPDLIPLAELKERSRLEMLTVLSGMELEP